MPHITLQITPDGPLCDAFVGVSQARRDALVAASQPVPAIVRIRGLIDTGASCTCIDPSALTTLGLSPTGTAMVNSPTTGATPKTTNQYDVSLVIPHATLAPLRRTTIAVIETELFAAQGFHALIGRDVLADCVLYYNGDRGFYSLSY
jgi:aspartyl protease